MRTQGRGIQIGLKRIDLLFYADDLALVAASRADLQHQFQIMERWLQTCNLQINLTKTEYIVIGGNTGGGIITEQRERILPQKSVTYLGYQRTNDDTAVAHLQQRVTKAKLSALVTRSILKKLPDLPVIK